MNGDRCPGCGAEAGVGDRFCARCGTAWPDPFARLEIALPGAAGVSDRGLRHAYNEDALALRVLGSGQDAEAVLAVVCDGVSSSSHPELAARHAVESGMDALALTLDAAHGRGPAEREIAVRAAAAAAGAAVTALVGDVGLPAAPACTFLAAVVVAGDATVGWIGDSRAYWLPAAGGDDGVRLTRDDSWFEETVAAGRMTAAAAAADRRAHGITAWLGADAAPRDVHVESLRPETPGTLVLCTDGLWNYWEQGTIRAALPRPDDDPLAAARALVGAALDSGGQDNVTVAVLPLPVPSSTAGRSRP